ncbi:predicted protein [Uncinocarpus reesii 1704]|uniref:Major facilitator superfamily (MFS) profile domain-containing protein n=1 Tax=Uncinocarpus reesii (strain UAMH 1704) TaxID=336963 RepID=C4JV30_UNCRE|nr:uncharacterized protein UREG_04983 [Uncinocarpus reesii 1704]EEP80141.1 predicted protein [Uncinocarpus reesii 1704]
MADSEATELQAQFSRPGGTIAGSLRYSGGREDERHIPSELALPPVDRGVHAWAFLVGCFFIEALIWGLPFSYGLFQDFYTTHEPFKSDPSGIAAIGTTALLVFTQGALYAVGGTLAYGPAIVFVDEWFVRRKGLAFGVMWAGTGFAGITVPFLMSWMLERFNLKVTLLAWAVIVAIVSVPLLVVVRPRIPISQSHRPRRLTFGFLYEKSVWFIQLGNILEGLGYFMPNIYLPSYARTLGVRNEAITATIALLNGAAVFGCIFVGFLIDRFHVTTVILISTIGATFSIFILWGLSSSIALLCIFSITYGFFAGGYSSTYAGIIRELRSDESDGGGEPGMVIGFLAAGRGIGSVICGPLSEALVKRRPWVGKAGMGYGTEFGPLIVFAGISALLGGLSFGARLLRWIK